MQMNIVSIWKWIISHALQYSPAVSKVCYLFTQLYIVLLMLPTSVFIYYIKFIAYLRFLLLLMLTIYALPILHVKYSRTFILYYIRDLFEYYRSHEVYELHIIYNKTRTLCQSIYYMLAYILHTIFNLYNIYTILVIFTYNI